MFKTDRPENPDNHSEKIKGIVDAITYQNEENGYTVALLNTGNGQITVVGSMPFIGEGDDVEVTGSYTVHPTYGRQFRVSFAEKKMPTTAAAVLRYLSSGSVRGVGPSTARKIVEAFGENTVRVLDESPEDLASIRGISLEKARMIGAEFQKQFGIRDVMMELSRFRIPPADSLKIYRVFGNDSVSMIRSDPFSLCRDEIGFPFEKADEMADYYRISRDSPSRIEAGIEYVLRKNLSNGHTCLPKEKLREVALGFLECTPERLEEGIDALTACFRIRCVHLEKGEFLSLPIYYEAEQYTAARLCAIGRFKNCNFVFDAREVALIEQVMGLELDEKQREAIGMAAENGIFVLTGGPGTGKTTTLRVMLELFERRGLHIELAAPTGRAAKRMSELTGREAKTLHRLLEVEWSDEDNPEFSRNEQNPLECDVIIVDEMSMVDSLLFANLLRALRLGCKIVLVGDSDQLPSVSAGNVLADLISSGQFACVKLTRIFRQAQKSAIVTGAHQIIEGKVPDLQNKDSDFFFLRRAGEYDALSTVLELFDTRLKNAYGYDPVRDIQVLCPSRKLSLGTMNLNNLLQNRMNPRRKNEPELFFKGFYLRKRDKVMQIQNNYELNYQKDDGSFGTGVFNGDVGFVENIDVRAGEVKVRFEDRVAVYHSDEYAQLELAYAVTVHKSQGSEFDCVILPLYDVPKKLCYRNLLYTAITRAKKMLVLVGREEIFAYMIENDRKTLRYTMLKDFLKVEEATGDV